MAYKKETLVKRLERLEESRRKENERLTRVSNNIGWGAGMRQTKCTPSLAKLDGIDEKIRNVKRLLAEYKD